MSDLPARPSIEHLRKQAKSLKRAHDRGEHDALSRASAHGFTGRLPLSRAQLVIAREHGFDSWPKLVHHVESSRFEGLRRHLATADVEAVRTLLRDDPAAASRPLPPEDIAPLLVLLRSSVGTPADVRACTEALLDTGADPNIGTPEDGGWTMTALFSAVHRGDLRLVELLLERGADRDEDAFYAACEFSGTQLLDMLYAPGHEALVNRKLDFEDRAGLQWFLDHGAKVDEHCSLHHAIVRGRSAQILEMLLDAGADPNKPWHRNGRPPLALAARRGDVEAFDLLVSRGAVGELEDVEAGVLALARGEARTLPHVADDSDSADWATISGLLAHFAVLGRTDVVRTLLDAGMPVDQRGWSGATPLHLAASNGRADTVALLIERGADIDDVGAGPEGTTPLDWAIWGLENTRRADGDYAGTARLLLEAGATTRHRGPKGDPRVDEVLARYGLVDP